eukprot:2357074-Prymnesium_polylepis.1
MRWWRAASIAHERRKKRRRRRADNGSRTRCHLRRTKQSVKSLRVTPGPRPIKPSWPPTTALPSSTAESLVNPPPPPQWQ